VLVGQGKCVAFEEVSENPSLCCGNLDVKSKFDSIFDPWKR